MKRSAAGHRRAGHRPKVGPEAWSVGRACFAVLLLSLISVSTRADDRPQWGQRYSRTNSGDTILILAVCEALEATRPLTSCPLQHVGCTKHPCKGLNL